MARRIVRHDGGSPLETVLPWQPASAFTSTNVPPRSSRSFDPTRHLALSSFLHRRRRPCSSFRLHRPLLAVYHSSRHAPTSTTSVQPPPQLDSLRSFAKPTCSLPARPFQQARCLQSALGRRPGRSASLAATSEEVGPSGRRARTSTPHIDSDIRASNPSALNACADMVLLSVLPRQATELLVSSPGRRVSRSFSSVSAHPYPALHRRLRWT